MCFPLAKTNFELNFSAAEIVRCNVMQVHFTCCVARARFDTILKRKAISRSANIFLELFQVINMIVTKSCRFVSGMIKVRLLVLMHTPSCVRRHAHVVLNHFYMDNGLWRRCSSGSPRSMYDDSMLKANVGLNCSQISAIRLSSTNVSFWVGPLSLLTMTPLLILSSVAWTRR